MAILPDFTIKDFIHKKEYTKEELKEMYPDQNKEAKEAITGEDGWTMIPVIKSSNILEIGHKDNKCRVQFKNLSMFEYEPISEELWLQFLAAKSKGEFFSKHIRNNKNIKAKQIL